jgi:hypothetical protein
MIDGVPTNIVGVDQEGPSYDMFRIDDMSELLKGNILSLAIGFNNSALLLEFDVSLHGLSDAYAFALGAPDCKKA